MTREREHYGGHTYNNEVLDDGMTVEDLTFALQNLNFRKGHASVRIDRGVRDFLVAAQRSRRPSFALTEPAPLCGRAFYAFEFYVNCDISPIEIAHFLAAQKNFDCDGRV